MSSRLSQLQKLIQESELDGYLVPTTDEHLNEYVPLPVSYTHLTLPTKLTV